MSTFVIEPATPSHLDDLYAIAAAAGVHDHFSPALLHEKLFAAPRPDQFGWRVLAAVANGTIVGFAQGVVRPAARKAWLGLFAVTPTWRRRGVASALLAALRDSWPRDIGEIEALAIPGNYFTPGIDPRYTAGLCFLERTGFERFRDCVNLRAELKADFDTSAEQERLAAAGIEIRRARMDDDTLLDAFFEEHFGADWRFEAALALANEPPALHLALRDGRIIAFSAHSGQNREWGFFGPMGTSPAARGHGLGRVLLWRCLNDLRAAGHRSAVIPWVGPIAFYHQWAGCVVERVFWRYRLAP